MAYELIYTSVPQGIKVGSSGFCTVAYTQGLAANIALKLEGMSAYKPYFPHYDVNANSNPVSYSHHTATVSGETLHFISRVCFYGLDYTKRSNKLAHHYVLRSNEIAGFAAGPAAVCELKDFFITEWNRPPQLFAQPKKISCPDNKFERASTWEAYTNDAGWAAKLAQHYLDTSGSKPAYIVFDPLKHSNILHLVYESLMLLPENKRWEVSFNTYFMSLPAGMNCHWRFCTPDADVLKDAKRVPGSFIIDLTATLPPAGEGILENAARTGKSVYNIPVIQQRSQVEHSAHMATGRQIPHRAVNTFVPLPEKSSKNILLPVIIGVVILVVIGIIVAVYLLLGKLGVPNDILVDSDKSGIIKVEQIATENKGADTTSKKGKAVSSKGTVAPGNNRPSGSPAVVKAKNGKNSNHQANSNSSVGKTPPKGNTTESNKKKPQKQQKKAVDTASTKFLRREPTVSGTNRSGGHPRSNANLDSYSAFQDFVKPNDSKPSGQPRQLQRKKETSPKNRQRNQRQTSVAVKQQNNKKNNSKKDARLNTSSLNKTGSSSENKKMKDENILSEDAALRRGLK